MQINHPAPTFSLPDLHGHLHHLEEYRGQIVVLNFWSAECPHVARADALIQGWLHAWGRGVTYLPIASNAHETPDMLRQVSAERSLSAVLHDTDRLTADLYHGQTTPHCYVIDASGVLRYHGSLDDSTFRQRTATRFYVREAVDALLAGQLPEVSHTPPFGCSIVRLV